MRLALTFAALLACSTLALQPGPADVAPSPKGVPVPQGEVVHRAELEGGLIVEDIRIGDGYEVKPGGAVYAHYHGTLKSDGSVFDSSFERGEPIGFPLAGVIEGWQKGVPGMKVGGVRRLIIPAALGYGSRGSPPAIPPNSDLVFTIALIKAIEIEDVKVGEGEAGTSQCVAATAFQIKDSEGNVLERADAKNPFIWFPREYMPVAVALEGMKVGGKRRVVVPKELNPAPQPGQIPHPSEMDVTIELEMLALRNIPQQPRR